MASAYLPSRAKISARTYSAGHNLGSMRSASLMLRFALATSPFLSCSLASLHNFITFRFASPVSTTIGTFPSVTAAQTKVAMKTRKTLRIGLRYQSVCNEKDRKSTRLNSSHSQISYAVFCLKKKKKIRHCVKDIHHRGSDALAHVCTDTLLPIQKLTHRQT